LQDTEDTVDADVPGQAWVSVAIALPFTASSAGVARHELEAWLHSSGSPVEFIEDCRLIVSELVGNAIRHATPLADGTMLVAWGRAEQTLDISVTDGGSPTVPQRIDVGLSDLAGRGLKIVESISTRWWHEPGRSRSTVHATLPLD
jgi:serine/threonine-protein kinase RsbW